MIFKRTLALSLFSIVSVPGFSSPVFDSSIAGDSEAETSSSKRLVRQFESPVSTSILSADQIEKSGATTIVEALRLLPGLIVREQTNGRYEVHIRGLDNAPIPAFLSDFSGRNILVMIDNRVVFEYFQGGTFWEALPVGLHDVSKIEVVRGAVTSLYGPNAAQGVIHIKTKRSYSDQADRKSIRAAMGNHGTKLTHFDAAGSEQDVNWRLSASTENRDRYQSTYYSYSNGEYTDLNTLNPSRGVEFYPNPDLAAENYRIRGSINNDPENLFAYDLTLSHQDSKAQKAYISSTSTPLTYNESQSTAVNLKINYFDWHARVSHHWGEREILGFPELGYDFDLTQTSLEYQYRRPKLILNSGVRFDEMTYDGAFISGKRTLRNQAVMLRSEFDPNRDTKLVGSFSVDRYNNPSDNYLAYQLAVSHKLSQETILRSGLQRANRSSTLANSFLDLDISPPSTPNERIEFDGDPDAKLLSVNTYEIGVRHNFSFYQSIDFELFYTEADDYYEFVEGSSFLDGAITVRPSSYESLPTNVRQVGATTSWKYESENWDLNVFATLQETEVDDQATDLIAPIATEDMDGNGTPAWYGGINANWRPQSQWNLNASVYVMDETKTSFTTIGIEQQMSTTAILNLTSQYKHSDVFTSSISIRNISNRSESQYYFTDEIEPSVIMSAKFTL